MDINIYIYLFAPVITMAMRYSRNIGGKCKVITVAKLMIVPPPAAQWMQKRLKPGLRHESVHISFKIGVGHTSPTGARPFALDKPEKEWNRS